MYQKAYSREAAREKARGGRVGMRLALAAVALAGALAVGGTVAWLVDEPADVANTFTPSEVTCEVVEDFSGDAKSDVKVKNTGDVDAYIRAAVVVNWVDGQDNVLGQVPVVGTDYEIEFALGADGGVDPQWVLGADGYFYWTGVVPAGDEGLTGVLISFCNPLKAAPVDGYTLGVDVICSAIQADGVAADGVTTPVDSWDSEAVDVMRKADGAISVTAKAQGGN